MSFSSAVRPCMAFSGWFRKSARLSFEVRLCRNRLSLSPRALRSRSNTYFTGGKRGLSLISGSFEECHGHRGGHRQVVVLVDLLRARIERAAHDEPHDDLGALVAAALHEVRDRHAGQALRVAVDQVEELAIPLLVVEPGALADHLVRETAGTDHRHLEIFGVTLDRLSQ